MESPMNNIFEEALLLEGGITRGGGLELSGWGVDDPEEDPVEETDGADALFADAGLGKAGILESIDGLLFSISIYRHHIHKYLTILLSTLKLALKCFKTGVVLCGPLDLSPLHQ